MPYDVNFQPKIFPALMSGFASAFSGVYNGRVYASVAPSIPTYPLVVYQSQDGGGSRFDSLARNGWEGLITFRSIDVTMSGAWNKIQELAEHIPNVVASGFLIEYRIEHPIWLPIERVTSGNIYTAAIVVTFQVFYED